MATADIVVEAKTGRLLKSLAEPRAAAASEVLPILLTGDTLTLNVYKVEDGGAGATPRFRTLDLSSSGVRARLGLPGGAIRASATIVLEYNGSTTGTIPLAEAEPLRVERELNALSTIQAEGGVRVYDGPSSYSWVVDFKSTASASLPISVDATAGDWFTDTSAETMQNDMVLVCVSPLYWARQTTFSATSSTTANVTQPQTGSGSERSIQRFTLSPVPEGGTFEVVSGSGQSAALDYNASAAEVEDAINAVEGAGAVTVDQKGKAEWEVRWAATGSQTALTIDTDGLISAQGVTGALDLSATLFAGLMGGASVPLTLDIVAATDGDTLARLPLVVREPVR